MQIKSSEIWMSSTRAYSSNHRIEERLRAWEGESRPDFESIETGQTGQTGRNPVVRLDSVELSDRARAITTELNQTSGVAPLPESDSLTPEDKAKVLVLEKLLEQVTGRKIKINILRYEDSANSRQARDAAEKLQGIAAEAQAARNGNARAGWGVEYDRVERFEETERTTFSSSGVVRTADGKEIEIAVDLTMSREFATNNEVHLRLGDAVRKDPLVINFDGNAAQLTTDKFSFDLDLDGTPDQISRPGSGTGLLAIDKNSDGVINDGRELFGPATGNGFAELAAYDTDHNQWIDAGDAVFNQLRIWTQGSDGTSQLLALGQTGIGAIYLGHTATPFSVNDATNRSLGIVQSTGIWLGEDGGAGTVQHLDLVV